jgi:integrase
MEFCRSSGWIRENPAKSLSRIKVDHRPTDYFEDHEMNALLAATYEIEGGERLRLLIELMRWSGLSIQDAITLERSRLNEDDRILLYRQKTGVPVFVALPPDVASLLREHRNDNPEYFLWSGNGSRESAVSSFQRSLRRLFKRAALRKRCHSHMFRDTFAVGRNGGSAIDGRTTRHPGYSVSQKKRKRIEECFGWLKTVALLAETAPSRSLQSGLDLCLRVRSLQSGANAQSDYGSSSGVTRGRSVSCRA